MAGSTRTNSAGWATIFIMILLGGEQETGHRSNCFLSVSVETKQDHQPLGRQSHSLTRGSPYLCGQARCQDHIEGKEPVKEVLRPRGKVIAQERGMKGRANSNINLRAQRWNHLGMISAEMEHLCRSTPTERQDHRSANGCESLGFVRLRRG